MAASKVLYKARQMDKIFASEKKGSVLKWFLFGNRSKHVLPSIKYPWPSVSRSNGPNAYPIFRMSLFGCEMQMERMAILSQLMCSNWSMWDAFMTSSAAVNKRFFHSSLSGGNCECDLDGHMPVNLPTCLHELTQESDVHRLSPTDIFSVRNQCWDIFGSSD